MKKYSINVHYDYYASVEVVADNEEDALMKAQTIADQMSSSELMYCDQTDTCVTSVEELN